MYVCCCHLPFISPDSLSRGPSPSFCYACTGPICRKRACELLAMRARFESVGARVVLISPSHLSDVAFKNDAALNAWRQLGSEAAVYVDVAGAFKDALTPAAEGSGLLESLQASGLSALHPSVICRFAGAAAHIGSGILADIGESGSRVRGGDFVVSAGIGGVRPGGVLYQHRETPTFESAPDDDLLSACSKAFTGTQRVPEAVTLQVAAAQVRRPSFTEQLITTALSGKEKNCVDEPCD